MLDLKFIREHPDLVKQGIQSKGESNKVDQLLHLDEKRRTLIRRGESLKAKRNAVSAEIARMKQSGGDPSKPLAEMNVVKEEIKSLDNELGAVQQDVNQILLTIPNVPHPSVPAGKHPRDNQEVYRWGEQVEVDFELKPHWDLGEKLGIIDFPRGGKVAGTGFPFFVGKGARFERALINFFLDHAIEHGYREIMPPILVNEGSASGTGQLPDKEDLMYALERDNLYLIPTAEVSVTNFHRDEMFEEQDLPLRYAAYTPCFRREAGSYGKDVRGLNRVHQFDKVELVKFVHPSNSYEELEKLRQDAEQLLQLLGLSYRVVLMCTGDLGFTQSKKYDLEVFAPGQQKWLEVSSCSNFEAFQARRINVRFKPKGGGKPEFVHTLNGSALALARVMAALIEQYQTPEGKVIIPKVLHRYTGFELIG